jgi:hypothetical protein
MLLRMRWLVLAVVLAGEAAHAENRLALDLDYEAGVVIASHGKLTVSYARSLQDDRAYVEARASTGTTGSLALLEGRAGIGLEFHPSQRVDVRVGWRFGDSYFRGTLNSAAFASNMFSAELAVQIAVAVSPGWRLHVLPLAPSMYWNKIYAASVGFELGVEHAF